MIRVEMRIGGGQAKVHMGDEMVFVRKDLKDFAVYPVHTVMNTCGAWQM